MANPVTTGLNFVLVGDELGQIKLVHLNSCSNKHLQEEIRSRNASPYKKLESSPVRSINYCDNINNYTNDKHNLVINDAVQNFKSQTLASPKAKTHEIHRHRVVRILDDCLQESPASSRAITNIRPIQSIQANQIDTTEKANHLFLISNKVGQMFICDTDVVRRRLNTCSDLELTLKYDARQDYSDLLGRYTCHDMIAPSQDDHGEELVEPGHMISPVYYDMNNRVPVIGGQPINQTNVLVLYENGDIQHVTIGQDVLQSTLKIRRKAIQVLGLGYNSDARAIHWRIDGRSGICYYDTDAATASMDKTDPLAEIVLSTPTHKIDPKAKTEDLYTEAPCLRARRHNLRERLVPTQVINMMTARTDDHKQNFRLVRWSSISSLNLIYKRLGLYDTISGQNYAHLSGPDARHYSATSYKLNEDRLAIGGQNYTLRVFDVQTQRPIYNCRAGASGKPLVSSLKGDKQTMISDLDWLGGNKTTKMLPYMLATCTGVDSVVQVYDLRQARPAYDLNFAYATQRSQWQPYDDEHLGPVFTNLCASGATYSTAVPSQQLILGATNGQLYLLDLRFVSRAHRMLGNLAGFCGGSVRQLRFVSESFEASEAVSCASDRFVRVHKISKSYTSVVSQRLAAKVFMGTKPTSIQPVCDEIVHNSPISLVSRCNSESLLSNPDYGGWSML